MTQIFTPPKRSFFFRQGNIIFCSDEFVTLKIFSISKWNYITSNTMIQYKCELFYYLHKKFSPTFTRKLGRKNFETFVFERVIIRQTLLRIVHLSFSRIGLVNISQSGTHQFATRKTVIRNKERTNSKRGTHRSAQGTHLLTKP